MSHKIRSGNETPTDEPSAGFGLIAALLFILIIAAVVAPFSILSRTQVQLSAHNGKQIAFNFVSAGLSRLTYALYQKSPTTVQRWQRCPAPGKVYFLHVQDQAGLIDLNSGSLTLLQIGFVTLGYDRDLASRLAERVIAYREFDGVNTNEGLEAGVALKHAPFDNTAELYDLIPKAPTATIGVSEIFTVFNRTDSVTLPKAVDPLKERLTLNRSEQEFTVLSALPSGHVQITVAEFEGDRKSGLSSISMIAPSDRQGKTQRIVERSVSLIEREDLRLPMQEELTCAASLRPLIEAL